MKFKFSKLMLLSLIALILVSCSSPSATTPTTDPKVVYTQVAQTVAAQITNAAKLTPQSTFTPKPTETLVPSPTAKPTNATVTALTVTVKPGTAVATTPVKLTAALSTPGPMVTIAPTGGLPVIPDKMEYVGQTITDNSVFSPGQKFTMNWAIKNIGTTTWNDKYMVRLYGGDRCGAPDEPVDSEVAPGKVYRVILDMTAPAKKGSYSTLWVITNPDGRNFGSFYLTFEVK